MLRIVFLGDIVGDAGLNSVLLSAENIKKEWQADLLVVNAENAAAGFGLLPEQAEQLFHSGVDVITSGNHIWQHEKLYDLLNKNDRILRPENYPEPAPGHGSTIVSYHNYKIAIANLQGRTHMNNLVDCPFRSAKALLKKLRHETPLIFIDFHAEDTIEKQAFAHFLDGKVTAIVGTHTHVQTMDEAILPQGTGYIGDLGLCGSLSGVIGSTAEGALTRYTTQISCRSTPAKDNLGLQGVCITADPTSGTCLKMERISQDFSFS